MQYEVCMRISAGYRKIVEADNPKEAVDLAFDTADFGEAYDIDIDRVVSCEEA